MRYQHFEKNTRGRDFVIGDLHGMYDLLMEALAAVSFDPSKDRCFSCGDLIDRGPDSEKCLGLIDEPWFFPVRGNHEQCMIDTTLRPSSHLIAQWVTCGGRWHMRVSHEQMVRYTEKAAVLPVLISVDMPGGQKVAICHAEYPLPSWDPEKAVNDVELLRAMQWSREKIESDNDSIVEGIDHIFCGHTIVDQVETLGNTHFIDTGGFESRNLTMIELTSLV
ncbi:metallophosphoesterase [Endozoicomonas ascidiicola]|uniref:metallophosphoesterase n=1 Tax=Endozoicomonas ascidiicola TaxID=1698521 RepID=UPI00082C0333|nr:metallophosphoesterase [Endozoicomonas ascidiicola]